MPPTASFGASCTVTGQVRKGQNVDSGEIVVRRAATSDYAPVRALLRDVIRAHAAAEPGIFADEDPLPRESFEGRLQDDASGILVAEVDGGIAGTCICRAARPRYSPCLRDRKILHINDMAVAAEKRRSGVGKALFKAAVEFAREKQCDAVELNVWAFNEDAIAFYNSCGMRCTSKCYQMDLSHANAGSPT